MKRPKHMTMHELIALPVLNDREKFKMKLAEDDDGFGGAFRDERGHVWGTLRISSGWVRYPAYMSLYN